MNYLEQLKYYTTCFLDGTCYKNFQYNNTIHTKETILVRVMAVAFVAGIISGIISGALVPFIVLTVGAGMFIYQTADGKNPPSQEFIAQMVNHVRE